MHANELSGVIETKAKPSHLSGIVRIYLVKLFEDFRNFVMAVSLHRYH